MQHTFNKEIFETLFRTQFEEVTGFVYSYVNEKEVTRDIVHDSFLTLWKNRHLIDLSLSPKSYLYKIARNYALDYLKHRKVVLKNHEQLAGDMDETGDELEQYERALSLLREYVSQLPGMQRAVLECCFSEGKTYQETADSLSISINTVKTHLKRAMNHLREVMKEDILLLFILKKIK